MKTVVHLLSRDQWIEKYGGVHQLRIEGFDVVPCNPNTCSDTVCNGWRTVPASKERADDCGLCKGVGQRLVAWPPGTRPKLTQCSDCEGSGKHLRREVEKS